MAKKTDKPVSKDKNTEHVLDNPSFCLIYCDSNKVFDSNIFETFEELVEHIVEDKMAVSSVDIISNLLENKIKLGRITRLVVS